MATASGVIGRRLLPKLLEAGHKVVGMARSAERAERPFRLPAWVGSLAGGPSALALMTIQRAAGNAKARGELGWAPKHSSWRDGFRTALG